MVVTHRDRAVYLLHVALLHKNLAVRWSKVGKGERAARSKQREEEKGEREKREGTEKRRIERK